HDDGAVVAATMLLTTLSLYHVVAGLLSRDQTNTIFDRDAIPAVAQLRRYAVSLLAIIAVTTIGILERVVGTGSLTGRQWGICVAIASSLLVIEEIIKLVLHNRSRPTSSTVLAAGAG